MYKQANCGRKNTSGNAEEHTLANADNANPYEVLDLESGTSKWYFIGEGDHPCEIGYETRAAALVALEDHWKQLKGTNEGTQLQRLNGEEIR